MLCPVAQLETTRQLNPVMAGDLSATEGVSRDDQGWPWWPLLPLYPYGRRRTLFSELIPGQLWSLEQLQGVYYVAVPVRLTVAKVPGGLMLVNPCLLYTSPSPRDAHESRMPSSA